VAAVAALMGFLFTTDGRSGVLPERPPAGLSQLVSDINLAQQIVDDRSSSDEQLASAGEFEQLATFELSHRPAAVQRATLARLDRQAAAMMRSNLEAAASLSQLVEPRTALPPWKIISPPPASTLLGYFRTAQARFGVPWRYLAAIELIETKFGRVAGPSTAGAQGPMQFMPATWAAYGTGDIHSPEDAILAAARYLAANGAPSEMADALYHYNPSASYVRAVEAYAQRMHADGRAYLGYYYWRVIYAYRRGDVILPVGYPKARPIPVP
jgi:soluble lytic murein transglycosylase-like protein